MDKIEALDVSSLSRAALVAELQSLASQTGDNTKFRELVAKRLPGIAATAAFCGRSYMGMAMSHWHTGSIQF